MALKGTTGSALSLGSSGLGLALGNGHAYAATGSVLGLSLGMMLAVVGGVLVAVGLKKLMTPNNKTKAAKA